jgi:hypothetical protein
VKAVGVALEVGEFGVTGFGEVVRMERRQCAAGCADVDVAERMRVRAGRGHEGVMR